MQMHLHQLILYQIALFQVVLRQNALFGYYSPAYAFISRRQPTAIELNICCTKNYIFLRVKNNIKIGADKIAETVSIQPHIKRKPDITRTSFFVLEVNQSAVKNPNRPLRLVDGFVKP